MKMSSPAPSAHLRRALLLGIAASALTAPAAAWAQRLAAVATTAKAA